MSATDPSIERVVQRATVVLGNTVKADRRLNRPHHALDGKSPVEAARTEEGLRKVLDLLGRIEYGVYE